MSKAGSAAKVKLNSFDDLFGASDMTAGTDQVQEIPLSDLYEFRGHPFKMLDDEKMQETVGTEQDKGIRQYTDAPAERVSLKAKLEMMKAKVAGRDTEKPIPQKARGKEETL